MKTNGKKQEIEYSKQVVFLFKKFKARSRWEFFKKFLSIWQKEREREHISQGRAEGEGAEDAPLNREDNAGLDTRTLVSRPELKADA